MASLMETSRDDHITNMIERTNQTKSKEVEVKIFQNSPQIHCYEWWADMSKPQCDSEIFNLTIFKARGIQGSIDRVQALNLGWSVLISEQSIIFLGPDMKTFYSYTEFVNVK